MKSGSSETSDRGRRKRWRLPGWSSEYRESLALQQSSPATVRERVRGEVLCRRGILAGQGLPLTLHACEKQARLDWRNLLHTSQGHSFDQALAGRFLAAHVGGRSESDHSYFDQFTALATSQGQRRLVWVVSKLEQQ